jgi:hypothetical protein
MPNNLEKSSLYYNSIGTKCKLIFFTFIPLFANICFKKASFNLYFSSLTEAHSEGWV